jgi:hypothetical protein
MDIILFGRSDERLSEAYGRHRWPTGSIQSGFACQPLLSIDAIITYFPEETEHAGTSFCLDALTMPSIARGDIYQQEVYQYRIYRSNNSSAYLLNSSHLAFIFQGTCIPYGNHTLLGEVTYLEQLSIRSDVSIYGGSGVTNLVTE